MDWIYCQLGQFIGKLKQSLIYLENKLKNMFAKCMICVTLITIKEMNMYSKKIGLTLATILPLVLVGCGGGDSSSDYSGGSTTSTQDNLNNGTR